MSLSADDVRKVARLARLAISEADVEPYRAQLSAILSHMVRLRTLDLTGVEPLTSISEAVNRLDPDEPGPTLPTDALMKIAPAPSPPFIAVPKILGDTGGSA